MALISDSLLTELGAILKHEKTPVNNADISDVAHALARFVVAKEVRKIGLEGTLNGKRL